jgi:serine/threonine protein kinase
MDHRDLETGVEIGDFQIEQRLGAGGMGIVYRARQVSLDRIVALKILGPALSREVDRMRFQREAQAVAKLSHPGIATVHFIGQDRHVCYMVMEFIDGLTLRTLIDRLAASRASTLTIDLALREGHADLPDVREQRFDQPTADYPDGAEHRPDAEATIPHAVTPEAKKLLASRPYLKRCCELGIEAALALAHAHERGVIHRDVKPENILVDRNGRAHLIDFGIARFLEDATLTNTGALVGTPLYMSPEQVTGRIDLDHRTDIYSLGSESALPTEEFRNGLLGTAVVVGLVSGCLSLVGFGLLAANRWARWAAIAIYSSLAAWALFEMMQDLLHGSVTVALGFESVLLVLAVLTIAYLCRRTVRAWFRLAAQLRAENRHGPRLLEAAHPNG